MFLSKISTHSCITTQYTMEENILLLLFTSFKINYKQRTKMLKNGEYVRIKNYETSTFEWMLKDIKIEKIISVQILATIFFWRFQLY